MQGGTSDKRAIVEPIPSATVLLVRDGASGVEVFMLVRNRQVDFASGALVFPGGKVDAQDLAPAWEALATLGAAHPTRPYWVAALRETFEETGLLIAEGRDDRAPIEAARAGTLARSNQARVTVGERSFADLLEAEGLRLGTNRLVPFAHWITPATMPKRFDTHFFLAETPPDQIASHDGRETVESVWIAPRRALEEAEAGRRVLVPATALNLEKLAEAASVADAFRQAKQAQIVTVTPTVARADGGTIVSIPADAGYATTSIFVPRPSPA